MIKDACTQQTSQRRERRLARQIVAAIWVMACFRPVGAHSSVATVIEVYQPLISPDGPSWVTSVPYLTYGGRDDGILRVMLTCDSNAVVTPSGVHNANLLHACGAKLNVIRNTNSDHGLWSGTMRVKLDLAHLDLDVAYVQIVGVGAIARMARECILANAGGERSTVRAVELEVVGPEEARRVGGRYDLRRYSQGPVQRTFKYD